MTVTATPTSDYLGRERHELSSLRHGNQETRNPNSPERLVEVGSKRLDNLELSAKARGLLQSVGQEMQQLLSKNKEYEKLFVSSKEMSSSHPVTQAITFLNRSKTFLSDPLMQSIALDDENFAAFYDEVKNIGVSNTEALKLIQDEMRSAPAPTYHGIFRR
ncbi:MAG: hypothetical protein ACI9S8_001888 [Chlamydiales bacterium]|jgi:hypothetical protein